MRKRLVSPVFIVLLLSMGAAVQGTGYYVSPSGSDSNPGTSPGQAWKTIAEVNGVSFSAGDRIFFEGRLQNLLRFKGLNHV